METNRVTCDGCGADLTMTADYCASYRLVLESECIPWRGGVKPKHSWPKPPIEWAHHFCNRGCMGAWLNGAKEKSDDLKADEN